jgi:hypothetical protein
MKFRITSLVIFFVILHSPARAQFSPSGLSVISGTTLTVGQTLPGTTGTVASDGAINTTGVALGMSGTSNLLNHGLINSSGVRVIDNTVNNSVLTIQNTGTISGVTTDGIRVNTANTSIALTNSGVITVSNGGQALDFANITTASNTVVNTGTITANTEDSVRPGANGVVNNSGLIKATPTVTGTPSGSDGIQANLTGVVVTNSGTVSGRHGITGGGTTYVITINNNDGFLEGINGSGVNIDGTSASVVTNVTNTAGGLIRGTVMSVSVNGDGDGVDADGVLNLTNSGTIFGFGAKGVGSDGLPNNADGVAMGGGTVINSGIIIGSSLALDAPHGDSTRAGPGITVDNSSLGNAYAATVITNSGTIIGRGDAQSYGVKITGTFADTITNNPGGLIEGSGTGTGIDGAVIQTGGGNDVVNNAGSINRTGTNPFAVALEAGNDTLNITGNTATITGNVDGGAGVDVLTVSGTFVYGDAITNFETAAVNSGKFTLNGSMAGADFSVNAGAEFKVNGNISGGPGTSTVSGVLSGTGTINNAVVLAGSGTMAPGNSIGQITVLSLDSSGTFEFEIGPSTNDLITVTNALTFSGTSTVNIVDLGLVTTGTFTLFDYGSLSGFSNLILGALPTGWSATLFDDIANTNILLGVTAIPEPSAVAFALLGGGILLFVRRMRFRAP